MEKGLKKLKLRQLDEKISKLKLNDIFFPRNGWIKEVRTTLGMTNKQLAKRLKVSEPTAANYEKSETMGTINIKTLTKAAEALNCKLVYAIVPLTSYENIIEEQTLKAARVIFKKASHTMNLEEQTVSEKENVYQYKELIEKLNNDFRKKIWEYEL